MTAPRLSDAELESIATWKYGVQPLVGIAAELLTRRATDRTQAARLREMADLVERPERETLRLIDGNLTETFDDKPLQDVLREIAATVEGDSK